MTKKAIPIIIALVVIGGLAWYFNRNFFNNSNSSKNQFLGGQITNQNSAATSSQPDKKAENTKERLIYLSQNGGAKEIIQTNVQGEKKTLFTDADETQKIQKAGGIDTLNEALMLVKNGDESGKLIIVKLDGTGKSEIIIDKFGDANSLSISLDGNTIAFVIFSNIEADYGYNLYSISRDGSSPRKLAQGSQEMKNIVWLDSGTIVYTLEKDGKNQINSVETKSAKPLTIYETTDTIFSLTVDENSNIVFSQGPSNKSSSTVYEIVNNSPQKVFETTGAVFFPDVSKENSNLAYLKDDNLYITKAGNNKENKITKAINILGWLP